MNNLQVGFGRVDITPQNGVNVAGYLIERLADGILDNIELNAIAIKKGDKTAILITADVVGIVRAYAELCKDAIVEHTGLPRDAIFLHATHSHTSIRMTLDSCVNNAETIEYNKFTIKKFAQVARLALDDLKDAKVGYAISKAERVGFNRRYLMKDGSYETNPGVNNPNVDKVVGITDDALNVLRFVRDDGMNYVIANYGNHPDTIGGTKVSGDWPSLARRRFERAMENTKCIFFNGCQGDINHIIVQPQGGDMNGLTIDFDSVPRGYTQAKHIGNVVAGGIMQIYEKVKFIEVDEIAFSQQEIQIPLNKADPKELPQAKRIIELHEQGRDNELPYSGMMLTTVIAEARRKVRLENSPESVPLLLSVLRIGNIGIVGLPGEPFAGIGLEIKDTKDYDIVLPMCAVNAYESYFPMKSSFEEGGYEAKSSIFKSSVADLLVDNSKRILKQLKQGQ